jgi:hypothetical protein
MFSYEQLTKVKPFANMAKVLIFFKLPFLAQPLKMNDHQNKMDTRSREPNTPNSNTLPASFFLSSLAY